MNSEGALGGTVKDFNENLEPLLNKSPSSNGRESNGGRQAIVIPEASQQYFQRIGYNYGPRPCRDIAFVIVFAVLVLASVGFGIFSIVHHNSDYGLAGSALYNATSGQCYFPSFGNIYEETSLASQKYRQNVSMEIVAVADKRGPEKKSLMSGLNMASREFVRYETAVSLDALVNDLVLTIIVTLILSIPFVFSILWLVRRYAKQLVYACIPFFILIPVFLNIYWFTACTISEECREAFNLPGRIALLIFVFLLCGIFTWIIYSNWDRVELTIRIMQTASEGLYRNMWLLVVLPCLTIGLLIYFAIFLAFLIYAYMNGKIVPSSLVEDQAVKSCGESTGIECCVWKVGRWVPAYYVLAIFTVLWSLLVVAEAQVYIINGTIARWYFASSGSRVTGSIRESLRNAFGPSFGTVCFSGLVVSFVRMIRAAVDSAQNGRVQQGCFYVILRCCMNFALFAVEFLNKFTINFAAITGESYCTSARMSYDLLRRNLLSPVFVETISTRLLTGMVFVLSVLYAIVVCAILKAATTLGDIVYIVAVIAWLLLFVILLLFSQVLDNVIDTVYICYAIDRDTGAVSKSEVHNVYHLLPASRDQPSTLAIGQP
eukprot:c27330_g1_i1 orf=651-2456(-)